MPHHSDYFTVFSRLNHECWYSGWHICPAFLKLKTAHKLSQWIGHNFIKTFKVNIGEEFDLLEPVPARDFTLHAKKWVFARSRSGSIRSNDSTAPLLKVPLKTIAPVGSLDAEPWYFGDLCRADCNATLRLVFKQTPFQYDFECGPLIKPWNSSMKTDFRAKYYPRGTFIIRKNGQYKEKYSLSVISRARRKNNEQSQGWFPEIFRA